MAGSMFFFVERQDLRRRTYHAGMILGRPFASPNRALRRVEGWMPKGGNRLVIDWLAADKPKNRSAVEILLLWSLYDHYTIIIVTMFLMMMMMLMMMMSMTMITIVIFVLWTSTFSCLTVLWAGDVDLRGPPLYSNGQRLYYHPVISHSYGTWWFTLLYPLKTDDFPIYRS